MKKELEAKEIGSKIVMFDGDRPVAMYNKATWECFKVVGGDESMFDRRMKVQEKPQEFFNALVK